MLNYVLRGSSQIAANLCVPVFMLDMEVIPDKPSRKICLAKVKQMVKLQERVKTKGQREQVRGWERDIQSALPKKHLELAPQTAGGDGFHSSFHSFLLPL